VHGLRRLCFQNKFNFKTRDLMCVPLLGNGGKRIGAVEVSRSAEMPVLSRQLLACADGREGCLGGGREGGGGGGFGKAVGSAGLISICACALSGSQQAE
jgi:hypothetical protein